MNILFLLVPAIALAVHTRAVEPISVRPRKPIEISICKRKEHTVRISPNPSTNGSLAVVSETKEPLYFYVFDMEGTMLFQAQLQYKVKHTVRKLPKGVYTYDVFRKDEGIEQGKITVI